eukprot:Colp12_sorted_trinity150504_noHs@25883
MYPYAKVKRNHSSSTARKKAPPPPPPMKHFTIPEAATSYNPRLRAIQKAKEEEEKRKAESASVETTSSASGEDGSEAGEGTLESDEAKAEETSSKEPAEQPPLPDSEGGHPYGQWQVVEAPKVVKDIPEAANESAPVPKEEKVHVITFKERETPALKGKKNDAPVEFKKRKAPSDTSRFRKKIHTE